jgi:hemoglobin
MSEEPKTPYDLLGGEAGVRALVDRFYDIMDSAPYASGIRAMHGPDLGPMRERLFWFMSGWLGGPALFFEKRPGTCIRSAHAPFAIGPAERDAWLRCMLDALDKVAPGPDARTLLEPALFRIADMFRSQ